MFSPRDTELVAWNEAAQHFSMIASSQVR